MALCVYAQAQVPATVTNCISQFTANNLNDYSLLIFDVARATSVDDSGDIDVYWRSDASAAIQSFGSVITPVIPSVRELKKVMVAVCNAKSESWSINATHTEILKPGSADDLVAMTALLQIPQISEDSGAPTVHLLYLVDAPTKGNEGESVALYLGKDIAKHAILERHHITRFSAGVGLLAIQATSYTDSVATVTNTLTTTTTINSTTTTNGVVTNSSNSVAPVITNPAANYQFETSNKGPQFNAIAGLTFYPFGYDTFTRDGKYFATDYAHRRQNWYQPIGLFAGTSVNQLGNFTSALSYDLVHGVQVFAGATWWNKTRVRSDVALCSGLGNSSAYTSSPTVTATQNSTDVTGTAPNTTTVVKSTTTTTSYSMVSGCANGNVATALGGTTALTQTKMVPAFSWGIIFNTNLSKAFGSVFKF
jgi:K+-transporting ATPase c subunit